MNTATPSAIRIFQKSGYSGRVCFASYDSAMQNFLKPFFPTVGRDNNFDILRVLGAALVIWGHGWDLTKTPGEPVILLSNFSLAGAPRGV